MRTDDSDPEFIIQFEDAAGPVISSTADAMDLIGNASYSGVALVVLPVSRLDPAFFRLSSGLAGDVLQKFVTYRVRVAVVGDIAAHVEASDALRDFVWESNRGEHVWFVPDEEALESKLAVSRAR
jgi:hypothetical protein